MPFAPFRFRGSVSLFRVALAGSLVASAVFVASGISDAFADTSPPAGTPATVSVDALPTVQIDGVVWSQVTVGNKVYATGQFTQARPAGVALGGAGSVTRSNLLAYDVTTGVLDTTFVHSLTGTNAEGKSVAVSPDKTRLYVGGTFSAVDGQARSNFAAFDLATNQLVGGFAAGPSGTVNAVAATDTQVFVGGSFTQAGGQARTRLASYNRNGTLTTGWAPAVTGVRPGVTALVVAQNNLIVGGTFNNIGGTTFYSIGAVKAATGVPVTPWASSSASFPIRDQIKSTAAAGSGTGITHLSTDGTQVYFTSYGYGSADLEAFFEGRAAINPTNGALLWANDCHGDSYASVPISGVLYSVGHAHDCGTMSIWKESSPISYYRGLAETTTPNGTLVAPSDPKYTNLTGIAHSTQLAWYPQINTGTYTKKNQGAWSITGNTSYVSIGGEFTQVSGKAQQGLARFAVASKATNKVGPTAYTGTVVVSGTAGNNGQAVVAWPSTWDRDNAVLTYKVYRDSGTTPIYQTTADSRFWIKKTMSFVDSGLAPKSVHRYRIEASDAFGNKAAETSSTTAYTPVSVWKNTACLDTAHNCLDYYIEMRKDTASGNYYGWATVVPTPGQSTRSAVLRTQITSVQLSTAAGVLTTGGPFAFSTPQAFGQTAVVAADPAALRLQLTFSARYADNALLTKTTGQLLSGQFN